VGSDHAAIIALQPSAYVDVLLEVHTKLSEFVNRNFKGDASFVASLDRACREFVNRNAVTGTSSSRSPEFLAQHADALLRKNNKASEEGALEGALNRVVRRPRVIRREAPVNARSTGGHIQVPRREGCLSNILFDKTFEASYSRCIYIGRCGVKHDFQIERGLRCRIHKQVPAHVYW
jgi:hypothetical protein